jgi:hypothetical protein
MLSNLDLNKVTQEVNIDRERKRDEDEPWGSLVSGGLLN